MPKRELLFSVTIADCKVDTFTVGGPGGGGKDTSNTGVRITHPPSGAVGEGREERSQALNKQKAFGRMARSPQFQSWLRLKTAELKGRPSLAELVEQAMAPENIRVEIREDGKWKKE
jgi:protein subunit release factor A